MQAALSGYSDWPMRALAKEFGASYTVAEVMIDRFASQVKGSGRTGHHFRVDETDHPVGAQLMGSDAEMFVPASQRLVEAGFDVIDINFGCPVKTAIGGCRGGYHLGQPETAIEIIQRVRDTVRNDVPVTVKMRRGIDDSPQSRDKFFSILQNAFRAGVAAVTVHGRTVEQKYRGPSSWAFLREVKRFVGDQIIFGSGDLFSAEDCVAMLKETGVDGVSIARGAIGNPWIFRQSLELGDLGQTPIPPTIFAQRFALERHYQLALFHQEKSAMGMIRKFGFKYARLHPQADAIRKAFSKLKQPSDWAALIKEYYAQDGPGLFPKVDEVQSLS